MPLVALVDQERVVAFDLDDDGWDRVRVASRAGRVTLPGCGSAAFGRTSRRGLRHFVHKPGSGGCTEHAGESQDHLRAKAAIVDAARAAGWSAEPEVPGPGYVADVLIWNQAGDRVVVEVQLAGQDDTGYRERTAVRAADGARTVWLVRRPPARGGRQFGEVLELDPHAPTAVLYVSGDDLSVQLRAGDEYAGLPPVQVPLARFVSEYLAGALAVRTAVQGEAGLEVQVFTNPCWKCGHGATVWRVGHQLVTGACGTTREVIVAGTSHLWADERAESHPAVRAAVAAAAGRHGWAALATLSKRFVRTVGREYMAFGCPRCHAVFGDFPLRSVFMEAGVNGEVEQLTVPKPAQVVSFVHWCQDVGAGLCGDGAALTAGRAGDGGPQADLSWDAHREQWQAIVNERPFPSARQVRPAEPIAVTVTIRWELDGPQEVATTASAWTTGPDPAVLVSITDPRRHDRTVWLPAGDVHRVP